jgi:hypothetical protein
VYIVTVNYYVVEPEWNRSKYDIFHPVTYLSRGQHLLIEQRCRCHYRCFNVIYVCLTRVCIWLFVCCVCVSRGFLQATASAVMNGINSVSDLTKERQEAWGAALAASIPLVWSSGGSVNVTGAELLEVGPTPNNTIARRRSLLRHSEKEEQGHTGTAAIAAADDTEEEESTAVVTEDADGIWRKEQRKERVGELNGSGPVQQTAVASQQRLGRQLLSSVSLLVHYTLVISAPDSSATDLVNTVQRELKEAFNSSAFTTNLLFPNGLNSSQPTSLWDGVTLNLDATVGINFV